MDVAERFKAYGIRDIKVTEDPREAVDWVSAIYHESVGALRQAFAAFCENASPGDLSNACYPFVGVRVMPDELNLDARHAYGMLHEPGFYGSTLTRPSIFNHYFHSQLDILVKNHAVPIVVGRSNRAIPLPFVVEEVAAETPRDRLHELQYLFPMPDLSQTDDSIANGTWRKAKGQPWPLALFTAERVDYSLARLHHYTGTRPEHFQRFVLLTNYQRYVDHFVDYAHSALGRDSSYQNLVEPGNVITSRDAAGELAREGHRPANLPQMPAWHLTRPDRSGITLVNIGVGPSNARTITDHLAVLRPHCWIMIGHCAGLRRSQKLGDYVLAHGYVREDHVLDNELPGFVPVPPIAEMQVALQSSVAKVTGLEGVELKTRMRTGTVVTTDNRNWELRYEEFFEKLNQTRAIAVDMESATVAANGFRFRVPYGTLLCVSDKPLHGELKLRGMADAFYRERVNQHLLIAIETVEALRNRGAFELHSRKLRSFDEPAFR